MTFSVWKVINRDKNFIKINDDPSELYELGYQLHKGMAVSNWFPQPLIFPLSEEGGSQTADAIPNTLNLLLVSEKLKSILADSNSQFEFFPIEVHSPNGVLLPQSFFLANLLTTVDCTDMVRSEYEMSPLIKKQVMRFYRLILHEEKIPSGCDIFRLAARTRLIIVSANMRDRIESEGCRGMVFRDVDDWGSEFRP